VKEDILDQLSRLARELEKEKKEREMKKSRTNSDNNYNYPLEDSQYNYKCPKCKGEFNCPAYDSYNGTSIAGILHNPRCPWCGFRMEGLNQ
jgi:predicted Zn-ribbon and HTH transcriptional regulator